MFEQKPATMAGFKNDSAMVGNTRIHYWIGGDPAGRPVLLWHGFLSTSHAWRKVAPALAEAGLSILVPDMPGFGDSDKPEGVEGYDGRAMAQSFRALVAQIGFGNGQPLIVAAHDMGGPPALLWAADHPTEITNLIYVEAPVMLSQVLSKIIAYNPEAMKQGSMWWWILPLAPEVPERLVVGHERAFLTWFYDRHMGRREDISAEAVDETLRTFAGREGVLGAMGVYRAAFTTIAQTEPLLTNKIQIPIVALGGDKGLGEKVGQMIAMVADHVKSEVFVGSGHFLPEEQPAEIVRRIVEMAQAAVTEGAIS